VYRAAASTRVVNYSSNFLLLEYSLISISGCKFPLPVAIFLQSQDKLLEFMKTWGFAISFATCQPGNRSEYIHGGGAMQPAAGLKPISQCTAVRYHRCDVSFFWATVYKTVRPMLSDHCSVCMFGLSVCNVGVLWPNG